MKEQNQDLQGLIKKNQSIPQTMVVGFQDDLFAEDQQNYSNADLSTKYNNYATSSQVQKVLNALPLSNTKQNQLNDSYFSQSTTFFQKRIGTSMKQNNQRKNNTSKFSSFVQTSNLRDESPRIDLRGQMMDGMRVKVLKRLNQKSKAAQVLSHIGFPQKKSKLNAELGKIQKIVCTKMDEEDKQFLDLLSDTSLSFFKHFNNFSKSMTRGQNNNFNKTEYGSKSFLGVGQNDEEESRMVSRQQKNSILNQPYTSSFSQKKTGTACGGGKRGITSLLSAHQDERLNKRGRGKGMDEIISLDGKGTQQKNGSQFNQDTNISGTQTPIQDNIDSKKNPKRNQSRNVGYLQGNKTSDTSGMIANLGITRPQTNIGQKQSQHRPIEQSQIFESSLDIHTTFQSVPHTNQVQDNSQIFNQTVEELVQAQTDEFSQIDEKSREFQSRMSMNSPSHRVSFKQSRQLSNEDKIETGLQESMNLKLLKLNDLLNDFQEATTIQCDKFETKKIQLIYKWGKVVEYIKQTDEIYCFETIFLVTKQLGDLYMDTKDLIEALRVYKNLKIICEDFEKYKEKMYTYMQIGYTHRLMKDYDKAVKSFKKMLQLAWQEKDTDMEVLAYDNLSIDYYYMGEIDKANYYNDRIMRGKTENDKSIVKKVSCNLLISRREAKHNKGEGNGKDIDSKMEMQRLPSPSVISRGPQFAKAINLLPHYTEADSKGIIEEEDEDDGLKMIVDNKNKKKKKECQKVKETKPCNFLMPELQHLNRKPNWDYLKQPKKVKHQKLRGNRARSQPHGVGVYRQQDIGDYKPFDERRFRQIVQYAVQMKETSHTTNDQIYMAHLGDYSTLPLNHVVPKKTFDHIRKNIDNFRFKFVKTIVQLVANRKISV